MTNSPPISFTEDGRERIEAMISDDVKWDLSQNDIAALSALLAAYDTQSRRIAELTETVQRLHTERSSRLELEKMGFDAATPMLDMLRPKLERIAELQRALEAIWTHCHIVYWPVRTSGAQPYPLEHNPRARKDSRRDIEHELAALATAQPSEGSDG